MGRRLLPSNFLFGVSADENAAFYVLQNFLVGYVDHKPSLAHGNLSFAIKLLQILAEGGEKQLHFRALPFADDDKDRKGALLGIQRAEAAPRFFIFTFQPRNIEQFLNSIRGFTP